MTEASATLAVLEPVEATLKMCVHFAEEGDVSVTPTNEAILRVHVVAVTALESLEGHSAGAAVVSQAKRFRLVGSHPGAGQRGDFHEVDVRGAVQDVRGVGGRVHGSVRGSTRRVRS